MKCPDCGTEMMGVEYDGLDPEHYDGISEFRCPVDQLRIGRWSGRRLSPGETEPRYGRGVVDRAPGSAWE